MRRFKMLDINCDEKYTHELTKAKMSCASSRKACLYPDFYVLLPSTQHCRIHWETGKKS